MTDDNGNRFWINRRDRILLAGDSGTGKTHAMLSIVEEYLEEQPDANLFCIDMDDSMEDLLEKFPAAEAKLKLKENWFIVTDYKKLLDVAGKVDLQLKGGDVLLIEGLERSYELAQDEYTEEVWGKTPAEYLRELRKDKVSEGKEQALTTFDSTRDWTVIRKMHKNEILIPLTTGVPYSVIATVAAKPLVILDRNQQTVNTSAYVKAIFGRTGSVPEGEKNDIKRFAICAVLGIMPPSKRVFTVVKLRGKGVMTDEVSWKDMPFWTRLKMAAKVATDVPVVAEEGDND